MNCPDCGGNTIDLVVDSNPGQSEHYCPKCDRSIPMSEEYYMRVAGRGRIAGPDALRSP